MKLTRFMSDWLCICIMEVGIVTINWVEPSLNDERYKKEIYDLYLIVDGIRKEKLEEEVKTLMKEVRKYKMRFSVTLVFVVVLIALHWSYCRMMCEKIIFMWTLHFIAKVVWWMKNENFLTYSYVNCYINTNHMTYMHII